MQPTETDTEPSLPETLEILLRGNLHRKSLRAGIAAELEKSATAVKLCESCRFLDTLTSTPHCRLHGRTTTPKNYCSWHGARE